MVYDYPTLAGLDLEVLDAESASKALSDSQSLYIKYNDNMKYYSLELRTFLYEVDWDFLYKVSLDQARKIVEAGYAHWWLTVPHEKR